jgi:hypothetical protein
MGEAGIGFYPEFGIKKSDFVFSNPIWNPTHSYYSDRHEFCRADYDLYVFWKAGLERH